MGDSDNVVASGGRDLIVTVKFANITRTTHNPEADPAEVVAADVIGADGQNLTLDWVRVSGLLGAYIDVPTTTAWEASATTASLPVPEGTPDGEYTISAQVSYDPNTDSSTSGDENNATLKGTLVITVGDTGANLASAVLSLGNSAPDNPKTTDNEQKPEDGIEAATDGDVWLKVEALNSLGEKSDSDGLTGITVIGAGGQLAIHAPDAMTANGIATADTSSGPNSATTDTLVQTMYIKVTKPDNQPGTVDVYALLIGKDGAARTDTVTVTFTGSGASLVLGDAVTVGAGGKAEISLDAEDADGNSATLGLVTYKVTDADGNAVKQSTLKATNNTTGSSTTTGDDPTADDTDVKILLIEAGAKAKAGVYTVTASLAGVKDSDASVDVTISGVADSVALELDNMNPSSYGEVVTATATVTDADGNNVADGADVTFNASGKGLTRIDGNGENPVPTKGRRRNGAVRSHRLRQRSRDRGQQRQDRRRSGHQHRWRGRRGTGCRRARPRARRWSLADPAEQLRFVVR